MAGKPNGDSFEQQRQADQNAKGSRQAGYDKKTKGPNRPST
ncbi:hypothetical protein [Paenibacillus protaetiae]|nr:hypothetical protein [Paenibacillus protaetiae]